MGCPRMEILDRAGEMQARAQALRAAGRRIGLVPTMGYLHQGHLSLVRRARELSDVVVVSVYVNPTQFGPGEDLERYPRDAARDRALCRAEGVDVLFQPADGEMYARGHSVFVEETALSTGLCGAERPGHFRGVTTVVAKLFNMVLPHVAVFGRKDYQQARVIERLVRDLNYPLQVVTAPTVREADGLAMSSRNAYLSEAARGRAADLYRSLRLAERLVAEGERDAARLDARMRALLREGSPGIEIDYLALVDHASLEPVQRLSGRVVAALAARIEGTRLIDNVVIDVPRGE